jgi:hypothetical protein
VNLVPYGQGSQPDDGVVPVDDELDSSELELDASELDAELELDSSVLDAELELDSSELGAELGAELSLDDELLLLSSIDSEIIY